MIKDLCTGKGLHMEERPVRKLGVMIIVATIPTALIGLLFAGLLQRALYFFYRYRYRISDYGRPYALSRADGRKDKGNRKK